MGEETLRLNDERALYGLADDDDRPDPANARTAAEFVALLGALVEQSGLSLAEIEELAESKGYVLPEQIIATVLSHDALPPEELVVALVRSISINDREVKYWVEVLWRLESRTAYDPAQTNQEYERKPPRDIEQIYGTKDEPGPSEPYVVSAAFEAAQLPMPGIDPYLDPPGNAGSGAMGNQPYVVPAPYEDGQLPDADEAYEEPYAAPMFYEVGQVPDADEPYEFPLPYGFGQGPAVGEVDEAESHPGEPPYGVATGYETVEYDEPYVEAEPVSPAASRAYFEGPPSHAVQERGNRSSWTGMPRHARDDDEDDDDGRQDDPHFMLPYETRDTWVVRSERPRIRDLATRSIRRVNRKARWPLPVAIGLSVVLAGSFVAWMALGGNGAGEATPNVAGAPPGSAQNQTATSSEATGGSTSPTAGDGSLPSGAGEVVPGNGPNPAANPNNPNNPNPQSTTQGPQSTPTQPHTYSTQLTGTGSTTCTNEGGQWRVRILVNVTVSDPPPGLTPQGQAGLSGSMQGFSLSGGGSSYSGSTTVSVGPAPSPNVGTVQWVVTMSVPGGRTARDESFEGYSCA